MAMAQELHKNDLPAFHYATNRDSFTKEADVSNITKKSKALIKCKVCCRQFRSVGILKRHHEETHMGKRKYICDICQLRFHTKNNIYQHMRVHSSKLYHCKYCPNNYKTGQSLWRHMLKHIDMETIKEMRTKKPSPKPKCDRCNKEFKSRSSLKRHNIHVHATVKKFSCDICAKKFASKYRIELHMVTHNSEKLYHCTQCNKSYKRQGTLNRHLLTHRVDYNPYVFCKICRKEVVKRNLRSHMLVHTNQTFICDICNKTFKYKNSLNKHKEHHGGVPYTAFECQICQNRFASKSSLRVHSAVHTKEKRFRCNVCNKEFVYISSLNSHKRSHNGIKTHVCKTCGRRFAARNTLNNHERIHTNAKPYTCHLCKRVYRRKQSIIEHMVQHTGIVIYGCSLCNLEFVTLNEALMHKNTHKRRERVICNACGKGFCAKKTLVVHLATHRDIKRPCRVCGHIFIGKFRLYRHVKESHKDLLMM